MSRLNNLIPDGTRDLLFSSCAVKNRVIERISSLFKSLGYSEVKTPSFEFFDVFTSKKEAIPIEDMFKLTDNKGRLIVLRPDCTQPIARVVATKFKDPVIPIKLYYNQNVFLMNPSQNGRRNEITQCGVELIGTNGLLSDIDIIITAIKTLKQFDLNFKIEIGDVGLFIEIVKALNIDKYDAEKLRKLIERKNYAALNDLLKSLDRSEKEKQILEKLPQLFGGIEIFDECEKLTSNQNVLTKLSYIKTLYENLLELGLGDYISVDLGLVHHIDYYTGIVFRGYVEGIGEDILSGGRYDDLLEQYGTKLPATGFGINVDALTEFFIKTNKFKLEPQINSLIFCENNRFKEAYNLINKLREEGERCEMGLCPNLEEAVKYAKIKKIKKIYVVSNEISILEVENEKA